jgi:2-polyprenyl-6-methoxyphenol hydroxylase-like FAD-dependent oxidoreductase
MSAASQNAPAVLVVGAGPTGLMMALNLTRHGIPCRIIDKLPHASTTSKALGVQSRTLEVFDQLGLAEAALAHGLQEHAMNIYADGQRIMRVSFEELHGPYPFILTLPQSQTEHLLGSHLEQMGVPIERQIELIDLSQTEQTVTATLRHADGHEETLTTAWLIGCDGAHSTARHILNVPFTGSAYPEAFALADIKLDWPLPDTELHLFLQHDGILAAFPMQGGRYRLIVETAIQASDTPLPEPTLEDIQRYLNKFAPAGSVASDPLWLAPFRTHLRQAEHSRLGRVFLVGDAAHIHSPAGGQGMNTGLQDAHNLAWKLALVQTGSAPDSLLDTYESERHPVAESVLRTSDMILKMATLRSPITQQIRNRIIPLLVQQDFIQQRMTAQIAELNINYRKSPIVAEHHQSLLNLGQRASGPHAGDRAPEAGPLARADGTPTRLFELLRAPKHTLLLLADAEHEDDTWQRLTILAETINAHYGQHINTYLVTTNAHAPASAAPGVTILLDSQLALRQQYGPGESLYLIRPDGYIGYRSSSADTLALQSYLNTFFLQTRQEATL